MQELQVSGIGYGRDGISQNSNTFAEMVLDDIFDGSSEEWYIDAILETDARDKVV